VSATLTPREREIALYILVGLSNKEIARELFITTKTVSNHLTDIYRKLGVRRRVSLAVYMWQTLSDQRLELDNLLDNSFNHN